jgi:hypothetical protein
MQAVNALSKDHRSYLSFLRPDLLPMLRRYLAQQHHSFFSPENREVEINAEEEEDDDWMKDME